MLLQFRKCGESNPGSTSRALRAILRPNNATTFLLHCLCFIFLYGFLMSGAAYAQNRLPEGVRGPDTGMATRSVSKYLALERTLEDAIVARDHQSAGSMLDPDFELRSPDQQDVTLTDDWLAREFKKSYVSSQVRDLSVEEIDDIAVVSFLLQRQQKRAGARSSATYFVVDVWRTSTGKLLSRHVGARMHVRATTLRPNGRE